MCGQGDAYECPCVQRPEAGECELERQVAASHSTELWRQNSGALQEHGELPPAELPPAQEAVPVETCGAKEAEVLHPQRLYLGQDREPRVHD